MKKILAITIGLALFVFSPALVFAQNTLTADVENTEKTELPRVTDLEHGYEDGTLSIEGEVLVRSACYGLNYENTVMESDPEEVDIRLETTKEDGACAEVLTERDFEFEFDVSEEASVSIMLNGDAVSFDGEAAEDDEEGEDMDEDRHEERCEEDVDDDEDNESEAMEEDDDDEDDDRGHGNDEDGFDENNPGKSHGVSCDDEIDDNRGHGNDHERDEEHQESSKEEIKKAELIESIREQIQALLERVNELIAALDLEDLS